MKNQVHPSLTNKVLSSPHLKQKNKNKTEVNFPKMPLFQVKELQIESKHDIDESDNNEKNGLIIARMCESITTEHKTFQHEEKDSEEMDKVKTSFLGIKEESESAGTIIRNFAKENEMIEDQRNLNILLNKQDSNVNYLNMQTKELLKLTHFNILFEEEKQLKARISTLEIACRKLKIAIRTSKSQKSKSPHKLLYLRYEHQRQKQLEKDISRQRHKSHKLNTKLLLLQNYLQKKRQDKRVSLGQMPLNIHKVDNSEQELPRKQSNPNFKINFLKHRTILQDRINVMKESIALTTKYNSQKIQRLQKQNTILQQEISLLNYDLNKHQPRTKVGIRRRDLAQPKSLKTLRNRQSSNSATSIKRIKTGNSYYSYYRNSPNRYKSEKKDGCNVVEYTSEGENGGLKPRILKFKTDQQEDESKDETGNLKRMQEYIAGEYFQKKTQE